MSEFKGAVEDWLSKLRSENRSRADLEGVVRMELSGDPRGVAAGRLLDEMDQSAAAAATALAERHHNEGLAESRKAYRLALWALGVAGLSLVASIIALRPQAPSPSIPSRELVPPPMPLPALQKPQATPAQKPISVPDKKLPQPLLPQATPQLQTIPKN